MVTDLATLIKTAHPGISDTGIEELITQIGLKFQPAHNPGDGEQYVAVAEGIDEDLLYAMGYTLGDLPGNIKNRANQFCNRLVADLLNLDTNNPLIDLQINTGIYLAGHQAELGI